MNSSKIMRSDDLRVGNRHRILRTIRKHGAQSRADIGSITGLSQAALSTLLGLMTEQGIVTSENSSTTELKPGRPKTTVALDPDAALVVTVALTIDQLCFCVVNYAGETLVKNIEPIDSRALDAKQVYSSITSGVHKAMSNYGLSNLKTISIGFQGVTDSSSGELLWSPILSINKLPIRSLLVDEFNVPVTVNNDCGLIAKALHQREKDKLGDSFAAVLFSHGVGLGVYLAGEPFTGAHSSALELGHVLFEKDGALCRCGKRGCIEAYSADYGIARTATKQPLTTIRDGLISKQQIEQIVKAANNGSEAEKNALELAGKAIGSGLAIVFTLLDPLPVALVGHNMDVVNLMRNEIQQALKTAGRNPNDEPQLLHCFHDHTPLLLDGLVIEAMAIVDLTLAEFTDELTFETNLA